EVLVRDGLLRALRLVPVEIDGSRVTPATDNAAAWLRDRLRSLSAAFGSTVTRDGAGLRIPLGACDDDRSE
ncbi:MAG: hypothetical protein V5A24_04055, partial [Haloarculaceae archaeon]